MNRYYTLIISKLSSTEPAYAIPRMGGGEHNQAQIHLNPYSSCEHVYHYPHLVGSFCLHSNPLFPERWASIFKQSIWIHHTFASLDLLLELWVSSHPNPILASILSSDSLQSFQQFPASNQSYGEKWIGVNPLIPIVLFIPCTIPLIVGVNSLPFLWLFGWKCSHLSPQ